MLFWWFFFFFQAEDGIRDGTVTGVQTCALPICYVDDEHVQQGHEYRRQDYEDDGGPRRSWRLSEGVMRVVARGGLFAARIAVSCRIHGYHYSDRSEERRVGKECRSRLAADP